MCVPVGRRHTQQPAHDTGDRAEGLDCFIIIALWDSVAYVNPNAYPLSQAGDFLHLTRYYLIGTAATGAAHTAAVAGDELRS